MEQLLIKNQRLAVTLLRCSLPLLTELSQRRYLFNLFSCAPAPRTAWESALLGLRRSERLAGAREPAALPCSLSSGSAATSYLRASSSSLYYLYL